MLIACLALGQGPGANAAERGPRVPVATLRHRAPLWFEENLGQANRHARFLARVPGGLLQFSSCGVEWQAGSHAAGSLLFRPAITAGITPLGTQPLAGRVSYLLGKDRARWVENAPTFGSVWYPRIYPGVDLVYYGRGAALEYDLRVAPGADPEAIRLTWDAGAAGNGELRSCPRGRLTARGELVVSTPEGELRQPPPFAYQSYRGRRHAIRCRYVIEPPRRRGAAPLLRFALGPYDRTRPLVIDPALSFSSFLGGAEDDEVTSVAAGPGGRTYIAGSTQSRDFPTAHPLPNAPPAAGNGFVTCVDARGRLVYSTIFGGSGDDQALAVAVGGDGAAYVTGSTASIDFPVAGGTAPPAVGAGPHAFLVKLNPRGDGLHFATCLGGTEAEEGRAVTVSGSGAVYVAGSTSSTDFPVLNASTPENPGGTSGWVAGFTPQAAEAGAGLDLQFSTYLGGPEEDEANALSLLDDRRLVVAGSTHSGSFSGTSAARLGPGGAGDGWLLLLRLPQDAGPPVAAGAVFLGGTGEDGITTIAARGSQVAASGATASPDFPTTPDALQRALNGPSDAFVALLDLADAGETASFQMRYATWLGGNGDDQGAGIAFDAVNVPGAPDALVLLGTTHPAAGATAAEGLPLVRALQDSAGGSDAFLAVITPTDAGHVLTLCTYLGGAGTDEGRSLAVLPDGSPFLAGVTTAPPDTVHPVLFPLAHPFQPVSGGKRDAWFAAVDLRARGRLQLSTHSLNLGNVPRSGHSTKRRFKVVNPGPGVLMVRVGTPPAPFQVSGKALAHGFLFVQPHSFTELTVTFAPVAVQPYHAPLTLDSGAQRKTIQLRGRGVAAR